MPRVYFVSPRPILTDSAHYLPFYGPNFVFSDDFPCPGLVVDGIKFTSTLQYHTYMWAVELECSVLAEEILASDTESLGQYIRRLDKTEREIGDSSLNEKLWRFITKAHFCKYKQFPALRYQLFRTLGTNLILADPTDRWLGVGFSIGELERNLEDRQLGRNVLGRILGEIRDYMANDQQYISETRRAYKNRLCA